LRVRFNYVYADRTFLTVNIDTLSTVVSKSTILSSKDVCILPKAQCPHTDHLIGAEFLVDFSGEDTMIDGAGHGTHVAGTLGSLTWGVAKKTTLLAVRVLDTYGSGTNAGVIAGMNYVVADAPTRTEQCPNGYE
jgi:subtilisin family serine protease